MHKEEMIEVIRDFYEFLLREYRGADFFEVIPSATHRYRKERLDQASQLFCKVHEHLDMNKCIALSVLDKVAA